MATLEERIEALEKQLDDHARVLRAVVPILRKHTSVSRDYGGGFLARSHAQLLLQDMEKLLYANDEG